MNLTFLVEGKELTKVVHNSIMDIEQRPTLI
jgi:hypothetical protein